ncbi:synaptotagmin-4 [Aplysia californica]|uniref:Synaptotagmin-4 n=1 Tax=Aplysia californica TaxID=6500 RepID=A0ABM0ZU88_APLCA|nr:synaptotagmin-4 [Aplysia californica]
MVAIPHEEHHAAISPIAITGIVFGCFVFLGAMTAMAYKCYRRRVMQNAQNRLSSAIKKGLQESNSGSFKKSMSVRNTTKVMKSKGTSPITPPGGEANLDRIPMMGFSSGSSPDQAHCVKAEMHIEQEKDGATPEKEDALRERAVISPERPTKLGNLTFSVSHDEQKCALMVTIVKADELPPRDPSLGGCDPYVKLQLLPEKKHKCKTRVLRKTLSPTYDETFTFYGVTGNQIPATTLHFVVLSFDRFSRDEIIGEVIYPLSDPDVEKKDDAITREITPRHLKFRNQGRGELLVSLCYQPAANRLGVVVLKARNLPKMDITGLSDPYVKIYLLYNGQRIAKKKTHVKKRTLNPVFNESFLFDVPYNEGLQNISLELLVLDWDRMTKNEVVGRLEIGSKCEGQEASHWSEVINCPRKQIAEWHKLQD